MTAYQSDAPPWDIGRPQRDLVAVFDEIRIAGSALDLAALGHRFDIEASILL